MSINHVLVGTQHGDEGKGKVVGVLCQNHDYDYVVKFIGGPNAGTTYWIDGKQFILHSIPAGLLYGLKGIVGPGSVIGPEDNFVQEVEMLKNHGIDVDNLLKVAYNAIVINKNHIEKDKKNIQRIGSTGRGIGPAYIDRVKRTAKRAEDTKWLKPYLVDTFSLLNPLVAGDRKLLFQGAQGFKLDVDWGDYPYVTSTNTHVGSVANSGIPLTVGHWRVIGAAKLYETYVGTKDFAAGASEDDLKSFHRIQELGSEFGATTGRKRQVNWLNLNNLVMAAQFNGITDLVINKVDIIQELGTFKIINPNMQFDSIFKMMTFIEEYLYEKTYIGNVQFSGTKDGVDLEL